MRSATDLRTLILDTLKKKGSVRVADIVARTGFSRVYVQRFFRELKDEKALLLVGKANQAHYVLAEGRRAEEARRNRLRVHRILQNKNLSEHVVLREIKAESDIYRKIPTNVTAIVDYAFTEMLNNAIEHSQSKLIDVVMARSPSEIKFAVSDQGMGIFRNIRGKKGLHDDLEAVQILLKGKQTTASEAHSGEGIFFTSKAADALVIRSSDKKLVFDNRNDDVYVTDGKPVVGTRVAFSIVPNSRRELANIFRNYTDDTFEFSKTSVLVKLYHAGVEYVSRSQARRILAGLDAFKTVEVDFRGVHAIGQGFADEVFRVWQSQHPRTRIVPRNAERNVLFMIRHVTGE